MAASYPGAVKNFSAVVNGVTKLVASLFNSPYDEITAIETELGTDVAGLHADLKTRLAGYDSGWFAVAATSNYTSGSGSVPAYGLGTTKAIIQVYFSPNSDGTGFCTLTGVNNYMYTDVARGSVLTAFSTSAFTVRTGTYIVEGIDAAGAHYYPTSGYMRVLIFPMA
jgi:hypothetical protein